MKEVMRYQLKKEASAIVAQGHPWIFRSHLSSAAEVFSTGTWLRLVDSANATLGYGIYDGEGLIGIRVLKQGTNPPDLAWFSKKLDAALLRREKLRNYTDAFRALHGENDSFPGIVVDVYGRTAVLQTYSPSVDLLGRYLAACLVKRLHLRNLIWKPPVKRKDKVAHSLRVLRGTVPDEISVREGKAKITVEVGKGQKSGAFLDLRGLRKWLALQRLQGSRVLNLFSYTGTLGAAAEMGGAKEIWNVDLSDGALEFAKQHHALDPKRHRWIKADVFEWLKKLSPREKFDLVIVDPPMMASRVDQVGTALGAYKKIYQSVLEHLTPRAQVIACCCTSRIPRKRFRQEVDRYLGGSLRFKKMLGTEDDHPVGFPEGDYLKILIYARD